MTNEIKKNAEKMNVGQFLDMYAQDGEPSNGAMEVNQNWEDEETEIIFDNCRVVAAQSELFYFDKINRDYIVTKITRKHSDNWMQANVIALDEAHHACSPYRPNGWDVQSIQIDGGMIHLGKTCWDFEDEKSDASDYDWDCDWEFVRDQTFVLSDDDDFAELCETLEI